MPTLRSKKIEGRAPDAVRSGKPKRPTAERPADPGHEVPESQQSQKAAGAVKHLEATPATEHRREAQCRHEGGWMFNRP